MTRRKGRRPDLDPQEYIDACKDQIDEFTKLHPLRAIEALNELEEYARERRFDVEQRIAVEGLRLARRKRRGRKSAR